jgi:FkbM family methyltransferase
VDRKTKSEILRTCFRKEGESGARHRRLHALAHLLYTLPGMKRIARVLARLAIQHFPLSMTNRQRLYNFFAPETIPEKAVQCHTSVPGGMSVSLQLPLQDDLSRKWYYWGYTGYEQGTTRLFCQLLQSKSCVFDVGANVGYYTILAATFLEGRGEVHAFEPWSHAFSWLSRNVNRNRLTCVRLNQLALSDRAGQASLFLPADGAWSNASLVKGFTEQREALPVATTRFDFYCRHHLIRAIDLVKIDVEGAELQVLRGMGSLLRQWSPDIICEVLAPFDQQLETWLAQYEYRKFLITDTGLKEVKTITAHPRFRDYYLSHAPVCS